MKLDPIYGVKEHPLPWLREMLNGVEHANFFEAETEYSKIATKEIGKAKMEFGQLFDKKIMNFE